MAITKHGKAREGLAKAEATYNTAARANRRSVKRLERDLATLGSTKLVAVRGPISTFVRRWELVEIDDGVLSIDVQGMGGEMWSPVEPEDVRQMADATKAYRSIGTGLGVGAAAGGAAYVAVPSLVATFATASTGTAITTLSGAAAANATLAWLGGGSLAAGGGGMAAGAVVLTGVGVIPIVLIGGGTLWRKSRKLTTDRLRDTAQFERETAKLKLATKQQERLANFARDVNEVVQALIPLARKANRDLARVLKSVTHYARMSEHQREIVALAATYASVLFSLVQCQLSTKNGNPTRRAKAAMANGRSRIELSSQVNKVRGEIGEGHRS